MENNGYKEKGTRREREREREREYYIERIQRDIN